jgi:hypothetical protein
MFDNGKESTMIEFECKSQRGKSDGSSLTGALVFMAMLAVVLIPFFAFTELSSVLGEEKWRTLLFTSRHAAGR